MVTVTLMKIAVAKNLSLLLSALNIKTFPKVFDNPVNILFLGDARASPGFHYATPLNLPPHFRSFILSAPLPSSLSPSACTFFLELKTLLFGFHLEKRYINIYSYIQNNTIQY